MFACCNRLITYCFRNIGLLDEEEPDLTKNKLDKRIQFSQDRWDVKDGRGFWANAISKIDPLARSCLLHCHLTQVLDKIQEEDIGSRKAVDLGSGVTSSLFLLESGWNVTAVDSSKKVLDQLIEQVQRLAPDRIRNLTCVCSKIEDYQFPEDIQIVLAKDSFPYCEPNRIKGIIKKAYDALGSGGYIVGNFFPKPCNPKIEIVQRETTGIWFTDKASVRALLSLQDYTVEFCDYSAPRYQELLGSSRQINFVGRKAVLKKEN